MAHPKARFFFVTTALIFEIVAGVRAQGTADSAANRGIGQNGTMGGTATTATGVRTGQGPLSQPIPPAVSTVNPQQNPQRPLGTWGPVQTNPPQQPFGSR